VSSHGSIILYLCHCTVFIEKLFCSYIDTWQRDSEIRRSRKTNTSILNFWHFSFVFIKVWSNILTFLEVNNDRVAENVARNFSYCVWWKTTITCDKQDWLTCALFSTLPPHRICWTVKHVWFSKLYVIKNVGIFTEFLMGFQWRFIEYNVMLV